MSKIYLSVLYFTPDLIIQSPTQQTTNMSMPSLHLPLKLRVSSMATTAPNNIKKKSNFSKPVNMLIRHSLPHCNIIMSNDQRPSLPSVVAWIQQEPLAFYILPLLAPYEVVTNKIRAIRVLTSPPLCMFCFSLLKVKQCQSKQHTQCILYL